MFLILTWVAPGLLAGWGSRRPMLGIAGSPTSLLCTIYTRIQVSYWKNSETLFRHATSITTGNFLAHGNLGSALRDAGKLREAEAEFKAALSIYPAYPPALFALANLAQANGNAEAALVLSKKAITLCPNDAEAHYNHAVLLAELDQEEAIAQYREALRLDPSLVPAHNNLASLLLTRGQI